MRQLFFSTVIISCLFVACDPPKDSQMTFTKLLVTDVTENDSSVLNYDSYGKLELFEQHEPADNFSVFLKPVWENGRLTSALVGLLKTDITYKFKTFDYNNLGNVMKIYSYELGFDTFAAYDSLVYNGRLQTRYVAAITEAGGKVAVFQKNSFVWDTEGNIVKKYSVAVRDGVETKDSTITVYTYDHKVNYLNEQQELALLQTDEPEAALSKNNILTAVSTSANGVVETTNVYTYDSESYPLTITTTTKEIQGGAIVDTDVTHHALTYIKK